jgi:hypothetical protein
MSSKLNTLAEQRAAVNIPILSRASMKWFMEKIAQLRNPSAIRRGITRDSDRYVSKFLKGGMYFFHYDPKGKRDMPYYDSFPLVLVLDRYADGFLGLNLHYLPVKYRIAFLSKLAAYGAMHNEQDEIKRIRITYDILNSSTRFKEFKPCLKKYLYSNLTSRILAVQPNEWEAATYLPLQQFHKAPASKVWQESVSDIRTS